jgi:hypothetical protein
MADFMAKLASLMPRMLNTGLRTKIIDIPAREKTTNMRIISRVLSIPHFFLNLSMNFTNADIRQVFVSLS